ncbi:hypothetical protein PTKIN_Ptkin19aG0115300 [Pterospermum kingtungense]
MDLSSRRRVGPKGSVVAGSVWETRIKSDEVKGGIKFFNGNNGEEHKGVAVSGKRKTWKSESFEGFEKNQILGLSVDHGTNKKSPIRVTKGRSEEHVKVLSLSLSVDGIKKTPPVPVKKLGRSQGIERSPIHMKRPRKVSDQPGHLEEEEEDDEKKPVETEKNGSETESEENCKQFGVCHENTVKSHPEVLVDDGDEDDEEIYEEVEEEEIKVGDQRKSFEVKEMNAQEKPNKVANEVKKISQFHNKTVPFSSTVNKHPTKSTHFSASNDHHYYHSFPQTWNKLQTLVDIVMWREIPKSALVFGLGTFIIILSSYTQELNISFISGISCLALVYLVAIFLYRSIICRGVVDMDESSCVVGEEEAVWLLKLVLPYLNEFLLKVRAFFSGDPGTTMKLAVLLFVLASYGSSITIWKMAKLGFFVVFTVPKVCSSYSHQLTAYGKFWIRRFRDAWDSCTYKKAVGMAVFTLVWNLSSTVGRIWADNGER